MLVDALLDSSVHVCVVLLAVLLLLAIRKTTVLHRPTRRTNISRSSSESCVWLQRLLSGAFDAVTASGLAQAHVSRLEEHVKALLEDGGFASRAEFTVRSLGVKPPVIVAVRVSSSQPAAAAPSAASSSAAAGSSPSPGATTVTAASSGVGGSTSTLPPDAGRDEHRPLRPVPGSASLDMEVDLVYEGKPSFTLDADFPVVRGRQLPLLMTLSEVTCRFHVKMTARVLEPAAAPSANTFASRQGGEGGGCSPTAAISPVTPFGDLLGQPAPVSSNPSGNPKGMPTLSPPPPPPSGSVAEPSLAVELRITAVSEPDFSFQLETTFTRYRVQNFFGFAVAAKYLLLFAIRKKLSAASGGITVTLPLPSSWSRFDFPRWDDLLHRGSDAAFDPSSGVSTPAAAAGRGGGRAGFFKSLLPTSKLPMHGSGDRVDTPATVAGDDDDDIRSNLSSFVHPPSALPPQVRPRSASR